MFFRQKSALQRGHLGGPGALGICCPVPLAAQDGCQDLSCLALKGFCGFKALVSKMTQFIPDQFHVLFRDSFIWVSTLLRTTEISFMFFPSVSGVSLGLFLFFWGGVLLSDLETGLALHQATPEADR